MNAMQITELLENKGAPILSTLFNDVEYLLMFDETSSSIVDDDEQIKILQLAEPNIQKSISVEETPHHLEQ